MRQKKDEGNGISVTLHSYFCFHPINLPLPAAYFTQATIDHLGTIDDIVRVRDVVVTDGMFKSTRVGKRTKTDEHNRSDPSRAASSGNRTYAAFPSPYQQQGRPGTPSTNPVLMHEPYQRRDQAEYYHDQVEPSAPYSQRSPSPASPTTSGQYYGDILSYAGPSHSVRSNSYMDHPAGSPYTPQYQSPQNYSNPRILSPPWATHDSYYYSRPIHSTGPATSYHHSNTPPHVSIAPAGHSSQHISPRLDHPGSYTPSYSLESALTPPQSTSDYRGISLAPLQIPLQYHTGSRQCHTPPDSAFAMEDQPQEDQGGLLPLNELKRFRYRREPSDEKTLQTINTVIRF